MKAQLIKENIHDFLKPKTEEELSDAYREIKQKTDEFMTKIFSDLHKDHIDTNCYKNNENKWIFEIDLDYKKIFASSDRVLIPLRDILNINRKVIKMLIESWLKENTDWPHLELYVDNIMPF